MGFFKKAIKTFKKMHSLEAITGSIKGAISGAAAGSAFTPVGTIAGAVVGAISGGLAGTVEKHQNDKAEEAQEKQLQTMRDIANAEAAAAAVPIATETGAQQVISAETSDINNATERRRALSTADTTSGRLQRWARNGKRKTLG